MAEENNEALPPLTLNLPPGYLRVRLPLCRNTATSTFRTTPGVWIRLWSKQKTELIMSSLHKVDCFSLRVVITHNLKLN